MLRPTALIPSRQAEFKAARLLFFSCIPAEPSKLDVLMVLRDSLPHTTSEHIAAGGSSCHASSVTSILDTGAQLCQEGGQKMRGHNAGAPQFTVTDCNAITSAEVSLAAVNPDMINPADPLGCMDYAISVLRALSTGDVFRVLQLSQRSPT
jgi:hypothetical protein